MLLKDYFTNVFSYARGVEKWCQQAFNDMHPYEFKYTYINDFAIADWLNKDAVEDTYKRALKEVKKDYKVFTEFIISLNLLSWANDKLKEQGIEGREKYIELYSDLYYEARDTFYDVFKDNQEAINYMYDLTD